MTVGQNPTDIATRENPNLEDIGSRIKRTLAEDLRVCRLSRAQVAGELTRRAGRLITEAQINAWTAPTKVHRISIELLPAWVEVTGSHSILDLLCGETGLFVATQRDRDLAAMGRAHLAKDEADRRLAEIRGRLCQV